MIELQQEEHPALQHFLRWREHHRRQGCISSNSPCESFFLPNSAVEEYFSDRRRVQKLLEAVYPEGDPAQYPDINFIQDDFSRIFCILLCIGLGRFIKQFIHRELHDQNLPFREDKQPEAFPLSTIPYWENFKNQQWEFCAPTFKYNMDRYFDEVGYVLPIIEKEKLREGGSSSTYRIVLHESYDKLHPNYRKSTTSAESRAHTYVLKTYRTKDAERYYKKEVDGFKRLRYNGQNGNPCPQILGFYGSFVQKNTYNILLEYADEGTLEDYFKKTSPPASGQDIVAFWTGFLDGVFKALRIIHLAGHSDSLEKPIFHGWHQDLKPANILVKSCNEDDDKIQSGTHRCYKSEFKVADLGLSHFKKAVPSIEATDRDARGTRTYGAPECCRDSITEESTLFVRQNVDVWSLGCILSEAVVWAINGYDHVLRYRQRRSHETEEIDDFDEGDCFHDGFEVLKSVTQTHRSHLDGRHPKDRVTAKVVRLIEEGMLVPADARLNAKQLCFRAQTIIKGARTELGMDSYDDVHEGVQSQCNVAKSLARDNQGENKAPQAQDTNDIVQGEKRNLNHLRSDDSDSIDDGDLESQKGDLHDDEEAGGSRPNSRPKAEASYQQMLSSESAQAPFSDHNDQGRTAAQGKRPVYSPNSSLDYRGTLESVAEFQAGTVVPPAQSIPGVSGLRQINTFPVSHPPGSPARQPNPSSQLPALDPPPHKLGRNRISTSRAPAPFLSFEQAMRWKQDKKTNKSWHLPYRHLLSDLWGRDCVFLIDNAASMSPYWSDVKKCLELLGYIVKETDKDGFKVYFTMNWTPSKPKKVRNATKLVAEAEGRQLFGESNMREALGHILQEYKGRLDKTASSGIFGLRNNVKRLSLYILTDGVWQDPCDISPMIKQMVCTTDKLGLHNAQIGIQFIQFGENVQGSAHLEHFDTGLGLVGTLNIVDNEPFKGGNVWKMLLGAINKSLDQDPPHNNNLSVGPGPSTGSHESSP